MTSNKLNILTHSLFLSALISGLIACGGGSSGGSTADTTGPIISSTTPAASVTDVERDSIITATFNEDIFATSVDTSSFTMDKSGYIDGTVTLDANNNMATFTPSDELSIHATYTATLSTAITDLNGNSLATDYSRKFTTVEGAWGTDELIEDNSGATSRPQVAFDGNGNALAVWSQYNGTVYNIFANRFNGTNWGDAELIEDNSGATNRPQVAFDGSGNAIAVWVQYNGTVNNIWSNHFNGTSWGTAELIETENTGNAYNPQVSFDGSGNALAVWSQLDGAVSSIWSNRFNGTNWGTAELIETDNSGNANGPQVAFDTSGNAVVVWVQNEGAIFNIWVNHFNGISWSIAKQLGTNSGDDVEEPYPQVAFDKSGNALAIWHVYDSAVSSIYACRFNGTSWGTPELIENDNSGNALNPRVALDDSGHAIAVWEQSDGSVYNIRSNLFK